LRDLFVISVFNELDPAHEELVEVEVVLLLGVLDELVDVEGGLFARLQPVFEATKVALNRFSGSIRELERWCVSTATSARHL